MYKAKWIWCAGQDPQEYNLTALFKKEFVLDSVEDASLCITADSWYRVSINGKWVHDGPARAYPNHLQYDEHNVSALLWPGKNRIEVIVRYFGIGTFHQIPQQAGLRAALLVDGGVIGTDSSWLSAPSMAWKQWTPKVSIQMEPVEEYDARLEKVLDWQPSMELKRSGKIVPRNVGLLTRKPRRFTKLHSANVVERSGKGVAVPATRISFPGVVEANVNASRPVVLASVLTVREKRQFDFGRADGSGSWMVSVNGHILKTGKITLPTGKHQVLFFCTSFLGHEKDLSFPHLFVAGGKWGRWTVAVLKEFLFRSDDLLWHTFPNRELEKVKTAYFAKIEELAASGVALEDVALKRELPEEQLFMNDFAAEFIARKPIASAERLVDGMVVRPSRKGAVELCFDLGGQSCGYYNFSIKADAGVVVDFNSVEFIREDGVVQHTVGNRNGMRYVTKKGVNRFTSLKRRSGRYLFVTFRNQKTPVEIRSLRLIESTADVEAVGSFVCSDPMLNRVWKISERTLQLCMEDTFTDCPLYEQTLWIGDARNEALYAFAAYGNYDVSARSLELGAQSLEHFPIVGCQVPSAWDCILPAWSFLWGIHVWEHYFHSGDRRLLRKMWPAVQKNMDGALGMLNEEGLFSGTFWNLIEWAPIDQDQPAVLHNNMLLVGALRAAENCAEALGDEKAQKNLAAARKKLTKAIHATWNEKKSSYPDSIHANGTPSPKTCQHTSMFPVMFDMVPRSRKEAVRKNLLNPPKGMTTIGSPFAMQFMYEALEELGEFDAVLDSIRAGFQPMVEAGADTVWETFPGSTCSPDGFPTRSHCHAWSSSPIYFLNRIVLGLRQTVAGGKAFEVSPWLSGLCYARGATAIPKGLVSVDWNIQGKALYVSIAAPKGVRIDFKPNASHAGLEVTVEILSV